MNKLDYRIVAASDAIFNRPERFKNMTCENCGESFTENEGYFDDKHNSFVCDLCVQQNPGILEDDE